MKKIVSFCLVIIMFCLLQGCSFFGGLNQRGLDPYQEFLIYDGKQYLNYGSAYVELTDDGFKSCPNDFYIKSPEKMSGETVVLLEGAYFGNYFDPLGFRVEVEEYKYLYDQIYDQVDSEYFEFILLKRDNDIYGTVNCYNRSSGRSGNLLSVEDLDKSYLISVNDGNLVIDKELDGVSVLAVNKTHYLAYENEAFYSVNKETGEEKKICDDIWYEGVFPPYYSFARVVFIDDIFMLYADSDKRNGGKTVIVGNINGEFEILLDNGK